MLWGWLSGFRYGDWVIMRWAEAVGWLSWVKGRLSWVTARLMHWHGWVGLAFAKAVAKLDYSYFMAGHIVVMAILWVMAE